MSSINEFKHETLQDSNSIAEYLKVLKDGFDSGELVFRNDKEQILLKPEGMVQLEVKAKKKDRKAKLSIKFSWKENAVDENDDNLIINSKL